MPSVRDVLINARDKHLDQERWADQRVCVATAVWDAVEELTGSRTVRSTHPLSADALDKIANVIGVERRNDFNGNSAIYRWNDAKDRTYDEVVEAYERAIEAAA